LSAFYQVQVQNAVVAPTGTEPDHITTKCMRIFLLRIIVLTEARARLSSLNINQ